MLGVNNLASLKLVSVISATILKAYGGVRVIKNSGVNVVLILIFIQCH